jgi:hypothetical protein
VRRATCEVRKKLNTLPHRVVLLCLRAFVLSFLSFPFLSFPFLSLSKMSATLSMLPTDCCREISRFLYPSSRKDLALYLCIKANQELDVHERNHYYSNMIIDDLCKELKTSETNLYDILNGAYVFEDIGLPRWHCENFEYLRSALEDSMKRKHSSNMSASFAVIERRRVRAGFCSGGCTCCGADLPLNWPALEGHNGFCSAECLAKFNNKLYNSSKINLTKETHYSCCYRYCKNKIDWIDLDNCGSELFCSDYCESDKYYQDKEDDLVWYRYESSHGW